MLTPARVHTIRVSGESDSVLARLYRVTRTTVRDARVGKTWAHHPTPVDLRPRSNTGRLIGAPALEPAIPASISQALRAWRTSHPTGNAP